MLQDDEVIVAIRVVDRTGSFGLVIDLLSNRSCRPGNDYSLVSFHFVPGKWGEIYIQTLVTIICPVTTIKVEDSALGFVLFKICRNRLHTGIGDSD